MIKQKLHNYLFFSLFFLFDKKKKFKIILESLKEKNADDE